MSLTVMSDMRIPDKTEGESALYERVKPVLSRTKARKSPRIRLNAADEAESAGTTATAAAKVMPKRIIILSVRDKVFFFIRLLRYNNKKYKIVVESNDGIGVCCF